MNLLPLFTIFMTPLGAALSQQPVPPTSETEQDVYAVYSTVMSSPPSSFGRNDPNEMYAIAAETRTLQRGLVSCIELPAQYDARWTEILAQIDSASDSPVTLKQNLKIGKPYTLLAADEAQRFLTFIHSRDSLAAAPAEAKLKGAVSLFYLSNVYFDKSRTLALAQVSSTCGSLCGKGDSKIYQKVDGTWQEVRPLKYCSMIA